MVSFGILSYHLVFVGRLANCIEPFGRLANCIEPFGRRSYFG
ncbi:hypothetical protein [Ruminococcus sp.]|nr:hypothetical protein [Ruminococcus sp.]